MNKYDHYFDTNKELWDAKTDIHLNSKFYKNDAFLKGRNSLTEIELHEMPDVRNKKVLHLQCHFGQDSLSMARMGAMVTGIDISPKAIEKAREFNQLLDLNAKFFADNVYDTNKIIRDSFDVVFTSFGVLAWLPDLNMWADVISNALAPGGKFYIAEFHPVLYMFDFPKKTIQYQYFNIGDPYEEIIEGTYADPLADIRMKEYFWQHSMSEIIQALINHDLEVNFLHEFDYSPYNCFENMEERAPGEFVFRVNHISLPHVFSVQCTKK